MTPPCSVPAKPRFRNSIPPQHPIAMNAFIHTPSITVRDSAAFRRYLADVSRIPTIDMDREIELARRIQQGDRRAHADLVKANLRFAITVAKRYQNLGLPLEDLVAEANIGLMKAADRFDHTKGFKFISYAVWWIRQSVMEAVEKKARVVKVPGNQITTMLKVREAQGMLEQVLERLPEDHEIAEHLDCTLDAVKRARKVDMKAASLDKPVGTGDRSTTTSGELMPDEGSPSPEAGLEYEDLQVRLASAMSELTLAEVGVLNWIFGLDGKDPLTLKEIGERMERSPERVRQIRDKAMRKLRQGTPARSLRVFLN